MRDIVNVENKPPRWTFSSAASAAIVLPIVIVVFTFPLWAPTIGAVLYVFDSGRERENNRHVNKAIYPAFRAIENECVEEPIGQETVRCQRVRQLASDCNTREPVMRCTAKYYYRELTKYGVALPPFYEAGYTPK